MAEEDRSRMDLDLNSVPLDNSSNGGDPAAGSSRMTEVVRDTIPLPLVLGRFQTPLVTRNLALEPTSGGEDVRHRDRLRSFGGELGNPPQRRNLELESTRGDEHQTGEGGAAAEGRNAERTKLCANCNGYVEDSTLCKKDDVGGNNDEECGFFDCNICFDLARDPVVTCCGHLFCWPCIYQWLQHHSIAHNCPVCKGEVTFKDLTPIYGRGNVVRETNVDRSVDIPERPQAQRAERVMLTESTTAETSRSFRLARTFRLGSFLVHRISPPPQAAALSSPGSATDSSDGRGFMYSIDASTNSDTQTADNAVGIESTVALSSSPSRRRNQSRDSHFPRRRRLN